ncbi:MAG: hypothetical protein ACOCP4_02000 [Candidatus Woesearchaeota archaeon]
MESYRIMGIVWSSLFLCIVVFLESGIFTSLSIFTLFMLSMGIKGEVE